MIDQSTERRSAKLNILVRAFEDYATEIVKSDHGMKTEEMQKTLVDSLQQSFNSSAFFHDDMAQGNERANDFALAGYHKVMSKLYKSMLR